MDALGDLLEPHQEDLLMVATFFTVMQFFAGVLVCKHIYEKKSTKDTSATSFISSIVMAILMLQYANMTSDTLMLRVNGLALALHALYLVFYAVYSEDIIKEVLKPLGLGVLLMTGMFSYTFYEDPDLIKWRYAFLTTVFMLTMLGVPLLELRKIFEERFTADVDLRAASLGLIVSVLWLLYSVSIKNNFMLVQNSLCVILCGFQIVFGALYPDIPNNPN